MPARMGSPVKMRVLLLGSDSTLGRDVVATLRFESCDVFSAADFPQALAITRAGDIDLLVLDLGTHPKGLRQLASQSSLAGSCRRTLIVADSLERLTLASETRVDGVLIKPIDPTQAIRVIHNLLGGVREHALTETGRSNTAPFSEDLRPQYGWRIDEL